MKKEYDLETYVSKFFQRHSEQNPERTDPYCITTFIAKGKESYLQQKLNALTAKRTEQIAKEFFGQFDTLTGYNRWRCYFGTSRLYACAAGTVAMTFLKHEPLDGLVFSTFETLEEQFQVGTDERSMFAVYQINTNALAVCLDHPLMGELINRLMPIFRKHISMKLYRIYHGNLKGFRKSLILTWDEIREVQ